MEKKIKTIFKNKENIKNAIIFITFIIFIIVSNIINLKLGKTIFNNFYKFSKSMFSFVPAVFLLIGIFEVWVKKEYIVKNMGKNSGILGYLWSLLLAGSAVGGIYVAFPIAYSLQQKGARISVIFTFIGAATIARVPMTLYEASYLGVKFTIIRLVTAIPLIILSSIIFEIFLEKINFKMNEIK